MTIQCGGLFDERKMWQDISRNGKQNWVDELWSPARHGCLRRGEGASSTGTKVCAAQWQSDQSAQSGQCSSVLDGTWSTDSNCV